MLREKSEYSICKSEMGWTAQARRIIFNADFREANLADMAGLDHIRDRTDGILDRNGWAPTRAGR